MKSTLKTLAVSALLVAGFSISTAQAAVVTLTGTNPSFDYNPNDEYIFDFELSASNPHQFIGANLDPGESFGMTVTAPGVGITFAVLDDSNLSANVLGVPNGLATVAPGTSETLTVSGDFNVGNTNWFLIGLDTAVFTNDPGFTLALGGPSGTLAGTSNLFDPSSMGGGGVSTVPVPAALPLMASALGMFGIARGRKIK